MAIRRLAGLALCAAFCAPLAAFAETPAAAAPAQTAAPKYAASLPDVSPEAVVFAQAGARQASTADPDADATQAAIDDFQRRGMTGLGEHEAALRKVLSDMPRPFVRERVVGDRLTYRADSMDECIAFGSTLSSRTDGRRQFVCLGNPYAAAAFYLGSYLNEAGRYDEACAALDLGLEAAPDSPALITERNASYFGLHRFDDAMSAARRGLDIANLAPEDRARLKRNLGNALTELGRLDEAEQAYRDSLEIEPGNPLALNELRYIARLKSGGAAESGVVFRPNAPHP